MSLVFQTLEECVQAQNTIFENIAAYWVSIGYARDENGIIGKTNGEDKPEAARITKWDDPKETADGRWYIVDPLGKFPIDALEGVSGFERLEAVPLPEVLDD